MFDYIIIIISLGLVIFLIANEYGDYEKQSFKDRHYIVLNESDKTKAAALLHLLVDDIKKLIKHLNKRFPHHESVQLITQRFNPNTISEGSPHNRDFTYTENKGEKLIICLRDKETMKLHHKNLLLFPLIHEIAHQGVRDYTGHGPEFIRVFRFLLQQAEEIGIYKRINFDTTPRKYCNMTIDSHP